VKHEGVFALSSAFDHVDLHEVRASRARVASTTSRTTPSATPAASTRSAGVAKAPVRASAPARVATTGGCGPGKKSRQQMIACWTPLVSQWPWPNVGRVWSVMECESQGDQTAIGPATRYGRAHGLMQIMNGPYDPQANMAAAWAISAGGTRWGRWDC
jgi:hypothetical protein